MTVPLTGSASDVSALSRAKATPVLVVVTAPPGAVVDVVALNSACTADGSAATAARNLSASNDTWLFAPTLNPTEYRLG